MFGKKQKSGAKKAGSLSKKQWWIIGAIIAALVFGGVGTYMVTQSNAGSTCYGKTIRQGSTGDCVKLMQTMLNRYADPFLSSVKVLQPNQPLTVDGNFGAKTKAAVVAFQTYDGTRGGADGVAGTNTWAAICFHISSASSQANNAGDLTKKAVVAARTAGCPGMKPL